jgi:hypothetical protein
LVFPPIFCLTDDVATFHGRIYTPPSDCTSRLFSPSQQPNRSSQLDVGQFHSLLRRRQKYGSRHRRIISASGAPLPGLDPLKGEAAFHPHVEVDNETSSRSRDGATSRDVRGRSRHWLSTGEDHWHSCTLRSRRAALGTGVKQGSTKKSELGVIITEKSWELLRRKNTRKSHRKKDPAGQGAMRRPFIVAVATSHQPTQPHRTTEPPREPLVDTRGPPEAHPPK